MKTKLGKLDKRYKSTKKQFKEDKIRTLLALIVLMIIFLFLVLVTHLQTVKAQGAYNRINTDQFIQVQLADQKLELKDKITEINQVLVQRDQEEVKKQAQIALENAKNSIMTCAMFINNRNVKITPPQWFIDMFTKFNINNCKKISWMSQIAYYESNYNPKALGSSQDSSIFQYIPNTWNAKWNKWRNESIWNVEAQFQATSLKYDLGGQGIWTTNKLIRL